MERDERVKAVRFFDADKFRVGLGSCMYIGVIIFFIMLAIVLPLQKFGRIDMGQFIFIALPAWVMIFIALYMALEGQKWWLYPHWLWTACKRVVVNRYSGQAHFITGWRPFRFERTVGVNQINALVLTSQSAAGTGKSERFALKIRLITNEEWIFFTGFRREQLFRKQARVLAELLNCNLSDLTYGSAFKIKTETTPLETLPKTAAEGSGAKPKGVTESARPDGSYVFSLNRRHEWPAFLIIFGLWIGIYALTYALGWTYPARWGAWEGIWLLFSAILLMLLLKALLPIREIVLDNEWLRYRLRLLGIAWIRKRLPLTSITRIGRQQTEVLSFRLVFISDRQTLKIGDLSLEAARHLEHRLADLKITDGP
jgi:hypothetical protein